MTSMFASLTKQDVEKIVKDKDSRNTKRSSKMANELCADYVKEKKLREPEEKKELAQMTLKTFYVDARKKELVQCIIKQLLDSVVISRIIKVSVRVVTKTSSNNCLLTDCLQLHNSTFISAHVTSSRWRRGQLGPWARS